MTKENILFRLYFCNGTNLNYNRKALFNKEAWKNIKVKKGRNEFTNLLCLLPLFIAASS